MTSPSNRSTFLLHLSIKPCADFCMHMKMTDFKYDSFVIFVMPLTMMIRKEEVYMKIIKFFRKLHKKKSEEILWIAKISHPLLDVLSKVLAAPQTKGPPVRMDYCFRKSLSHLTTHI